MTEFVITATDRRRAAALVGHYLAGRSDGVSAIFHEINEDGRNTTLVLALLDFFEVLNPSLNTPEGREYLESQILKYAQEET